MREAMNEKGAILLAVCRAKYSEGILFNYFQNIKVITLKISYQES